MLSFYIFEIVVCVCITQIENIYNLLFALFTDIYSSLIILVHHHMSVTELLSNAKKSDSNNRNKFVYESF